MLLQKALRIQPGQMVTFTGAGGKTSALRLLIHEFHSQTPTIITTTTRFGINQFPSVDCHLVDAGDQDLTSIVRKLEANPGVLWTGPPVQGQDKLNGINPKRIDAIKSLCAEIGAILLVEGDGAKGRLVKAPAEHEPVVPSKSDLVVPVLGLGALNQPLSERIAHRPDLIAGITGYKEGKLLGTVHLASLLASSQGGLKGIPQGAKVRVLLAGAGKAKQPAAIELARACLQRTSLIQAGVLAELGSEDPVVRVEGRVAGVLLAAGGASRLGDLKQVRQWRGKPLIQHILEQAQLAGLDPLVVIAGQESERVRAALAAAEVPVIDNPAWSHGQSTSMKLGLEQVAQQIEGVVFLLADMPLVQAKTIQQLRQVHAKSLAPIVAPQAQGRFGNPVLFDQSTFQALSKVRGDRGGKAIFRQFEIAAVPADDTVLFDVDTEEDWQQLQEYEEA